MEVAIKHCRSELRCMCKLDLKRRSREYRRQPKRKFSFKKFSKTFAFVSIFKKCPEPKGKTHPGPYPLQSRGRTCTHSNRNHRVISVTCGRASTGEECCQESDGNDSVRRHYSSVRVAGGGWVVQSDLSLGFAS
jgi:hypothetical protein